LITEYLLLDLVAPRNSSSLKFVICINEYAVPDFRGDPSCVEKVAKSGLDVFAHNIETVEELQRMVRDHRANFKQSIDVLKLAKEHAPAGTLTKTSIMLGCGETPDQVISTMEKVRAAGVDVMTFGQYMRPSKRHMPVSEYVTPEAFEKYRSLGMEMGDNDGAVAHDGGAATDDVGGFDGGAVIEPDGGLDGGSATEPGGGFVGGAAAEPAGGLEGGAAVEPDGGFDGGAATEPDGGFDSGAATETDGGSDGGSGVGVAGGLDGGVEIEDEGGFAGGDETGVGGGVGGGCAIGGGECRGTGDADGSGDACGGSAAVHGQRKKHEGLGRERRRVFRDASRRRGGRRRTTAMKGSLGKVAELGEEGNATGVHRHAQGGRLDDVTEALGSDEVDAEGNEAAGPAGTKVSVALLKVRSADLDGSFSKRAVGGRVSVRRHVGGGDREPEGHGCYEEE
ncbi:hypothetical protein B296_00011844, partial [Ensete ventricosum]